MLARLAVTCGVGLMLWVIIVSQSWALRIGTAGVLLALFIHAAWRSYDDDSNE